MRHPALLPILIFISAIASVPASAKWQLDNENSLLNFSSVKKGTVAENHYFERLTGEIDENGELVVNVDLTSVNTAIAIRDERMKKFVFETDKFSSAKFKAQLDKAMLKKLKTGSITQVQVKGTVDFHGHSQETIIDVNVIKLNKNMIAVNTIKPFFIKADAYGVIAGINTLKELAALPSIDYVVPVNFSVAFVQ